MHNIPIYLLGSQYGSQKVVYVAFYTISVNHKNGSKLEKILTRLLARYNVPPPTIASLTIRGRVCGKVRTLIEATAYLIPFAGLPEDEVFGVFPLVQAWHEDVSQLVLGLKTYPTGMDLAEAQWRALSFTGGWDEPAPPELRHAYEAWTQLVADIIKMQYNASAINGLPGFKESVLQHVNGAKPSELALARYPPADASV
ncbi:hypothetical protein MMC13_000166 [Lambiella insularis]|nr:hypothetical protein [Lambiella insularis]